MLARALAVPKIPGQVELEALPAAALVVSARPRTRDAQALVAEVARHLRDPFEEFPDVREPGSRPVLPFLEHVLRVDLPEDQDQRLAFLLEAAQDHDRADRRLVLVGPVLADADEPACPATSPVGADAVKHRGRRRRRAA